ncbi:hypothetical protein BofuT4_P050900.1 [Botrytis cinerea T4]|uniref:Uncharacterized protein n=1 Tax=Botryotinia fuckeliana (strain T4) TaxID=999810 RepID=G2XWZ4_BOTF4|nr:hypothetical protein BofuT4_P050900.1 [Botrytis cinerea T4]
MLSHIHLVPKHDPGHCISESPHKGNLITTVGNELRNCGTTRLRVRAEVLEKETQPRSTYLLSTTRIALNTSQHVAKPDLGRTVSLAISPRELETGLGAGSWELDTMHFTRNLKTRDKSIYLLDLRQSCHLARPNYALRIQVALLGQYSFCPRGSGTSMGPRP